MNNELRHNIAIASFLMNNELRHNIVKVDCGSTRLSPSCIHRYFDTVMTKFMINNRTDALKTNIKLFFTITNCWIACSRSLTRRMNFKFVSVCILAITISQWACVNFCSYRKNHIAIHARVMLLIAACIPWEMAQTLPASGDSIQKWKLLTVSLGIDIENKTFQLFTCLY